jgi:hypothetical protein
MPFQQGVRDVVIKDRWLRREDGRAQNRKMAYGTEA